MTEKINIGVIFGGKSGEHDVSLVSASNVINAIDKSKFDVSLIGIDREGVWKIYKGDVKNIALDKWEEDTSNIRDTFSLFDDEEINRIDIFFPVLHGTFGEDGTIQGLFEMLAKPYVGCGVLASSAAMDKHIAKLLFEAAGIPVAKSIVFTKKEIQNDADKCVHEAEAIFSYPVFVKPANMGSSVGISKSADTAELKKALYEASNYDEKILLEEFIDGYEVEVAVLGNENAQSSCPGMIRPCNDFYDYEAKYQSGDESKTEIPAPIPEQTSLQLREYAVKAYEVLGCSGLSRVDFFVKKTSGEIVLNEVNTMPGFTNISMYPKLWEQCGIAYADLIERLIDFGFERYNNRKELAFKKQ